MKERILGKEIEVEYEKSGAFHTFRAITYGVLTTDLKRDKAYAKFKKDLTKAVQAPK